MNTNTTTETLSINDIRENNADAEKTRRDHEYANPTLGDTDAGRALVGLAPSNGAQVSGNTLFDEVFNLSSVGQVQALRTVANGALYAAIMIAHDIVSWDGPTHDDGTLNEAEVRRLEYYESLPRRLQQQIDLYEYAVSELMPLATSQFDQAMDFDTMFEFVANNASRRNDNDELPDDVLEALGVTRAQLKLIDAAEAKKQQAKDADLRASIRAHEASIRAEVHIDPDRGNSNVCDTLNAQQHANLLQKVAKKLQARVSQLLAIRSRYDGALGEAMLIAADGKTIDKAYAAFVRRNAAELQQAA